MNKKGIFPAEQLKQREVSFVLLLYSEGGLGWLDRKGGFGLEGRKAQRGRDGSGADAWSAHDLRAMAGKRTGNGTKRPS